MIRRLLARWRRGFVRSGLGVDLDPIRDDINRLREDLATQSRDLVERDDTLAAAYDRRVAATANRLLRLEEELAEDGAGASRAPDAHEALASHGRTGHAPELRHAFAGIDPPDAAAIASAADLVSAHGPVLDVGCHLEAVLAERGVETEAVDAYPVAVQEALNRHKPESLGAAALLLIIEQLEVPDLDRLFRSLAAGIRPSGVIFIHALDPESAEGQRRLWRDPTRCRLYGPATIEVLLSAAGFNPADPTPNGKDGTYTLVATRA